MFELMGRIKPLHLMHLPYDTSGGHALDFWRQEMTRLKDFLQDQTGYVIEVQALNRQIKLQSEVRRLLWRISRYSTADNGDFYPDISGHGAKRNLRRRDRRSIAAMTCCLLKGGLLRTKPRLPTRTGGAR